MPKFRRAFTLIELMVVVGVITILISILMPALQKVRAQAYAVGCQSNIRQIMLAFTYFSMEHDNHLPGTYYSEFLASGAPDPDPNHADWLQGYGDFNSLPQSGTIWKYLNNTKAYLCPQAEADFVASYGGSNGKFDYAFFQPFAGAKLTSIPYESTLTDLSGHSWSMPTPIVCHEDAYQMNGGNIEGDHGNVDQITHIHMKGGYYGAVDCSAIFVVEPDIQNGWSNGCWDWQTRTPHGNMANLGGSPVRYWDQWETF